MDIDTINAQIDQTEKHLDQLYAARRGRVEYNGAGNVKRAWCTCCGIWPVDAESGIDTCDSCRQCGVRH